MKNSSIYKIFICVSLALSANIYSFAAGEFVIVRSKNFNFVSEAGEETIRRQALRLEQFREVFRRAFPGLRTDAPAPPTVLIFKDSINFEPFKPVRENGLSDTSVSGFFQSSDEGNFIAFPISGDVEKNSGTIFHEYLHFIIKNNFQTTNLPAWLNEGLAEYYQTFRMKNDRKAVFGEKQKAHLELLRRYKMIPLKTLAAVDYPSLSQMTLEEKRLFYAQSWAIVHYLIQENDGLLNTPIKKYLALNAGSKSTETAFEEAFNKKYFEIESDLEAYVSKKSPEGNEVIFSEKIDFETRLESQFVSEAVWLRYLGDLLFQSSRYDAAAGILRRSLALDEKSAAANLSLGKILMRQGKNAEAAVFFEKAVASDAENYAANYYLADVLFRGNISAEGYVNKFPPEQAKKMRLLLKNAVGQNPGLIEAYRMLALISLANNDEIAESIAYLETAQKTGVLDFRLEYNLAQLYLYRKDFERARKTAAAMSKKCSDKDFCERVKGFIAALDSIEQKEKEIAELRRKYGLENVDFEAENLLSPEEAMNRALNRSLRKPLENERRFTGRLTEIVCGEKVKFKIKGETRNLELNKNSFDGILLISFSRNTAGMRIECGAPKTEMFVVATYKTGAPEKSGSSGELLILEFVPKEFKLIQ